LPILNGNASVEGIGRRSSQRAASASEFAAIARLPEALGRHRGRWPSWSSERCVDQVFRVIDLPAEVNPEKAISHAQGRILQLAMPKTAAARNVKTEAKAV